VGLDMVELLSKYAAGDRRERSVVHAQHHHPHSPAGSPLGHNRPTQSITPWENIPPPLCPRSAQIVVHFAEDVSTTASLIMSGLPYDRTPSPQPETPALETALTEPSALDMALDDYVPAGQPMPDHVQSLMGRMSKGKVYLLDESPAIVLVDGKERIRGDPVSLTSPAQLA